MKIITTQQMTKIEEKSEKDFSLSRAQLMENAGTGIANWVNDFVIKKSLKKQILIVCGSGNNGGDGFVSARILCNKGFNVNVICLVEESALKEPAKNNFARIKKIKKIKISKVRNKTNLEKIDKSFDDSELILDCILGTGIAGEVRGLKKTIISYINSLSKKVISVDIPSGLNGDTGKGLSIKACTTLTLGLPKIGLLQSGVEGKTGKIIVIDINFPAELLDATRSNLHYLHQNDFKGLLPKRKIACHKGNFGHVLVLAGSPGYTGAATLCTQGALRAGAGLVTLGIPKGLQKVFQLKLTEAMTLALPETKQCTLALDAYPHIKDFMKKVDCLVLGPGLSQNQETVKLIRKLILNTTKPTVVDADGINAIADDLTLLLRTKYSLILTPHPGEFKRLTNMSVDYIQKNRLKVVRDFTEKYKITIVLKGSHSAIAGNDKKVYINSSGNPGMASGGTGDVLAGIIAGILAQGIETLDSARFGVYIHGIAGDMAAQEKGEVGILAGDLVEKVPYAINTIYDN